MTISQELSVKQRDVIFNDMDVVTQKVATEGKDKMGKGYQVQCLIAYDIGDLLGSLMTAEHLNDAQKKNELRKLLAFWNQADISLSKLYDLRNVSATFDREFIKGQIGEPFVNGGYLTWSHFRELQKLSSEKRQLAVLKKCRRHGWSANELALELQSKKESEVKRSGGRKPTLPKTPNAMLQKLYTTVGQSHNYLTAVTEPLQGIFMEMTASDVDEAFLGSIDENLERIKETAADMKAAAAQLQKVRKRTVTVLSTAANKGEKEPEAQLALSAKQAPAEVPPIQSKKGRGTPRRSKKKGVVQGNKKG
tara:strand:- start:8033 stop:8953 length:921 start_codon:yes stop_codon:yes gene_type:complete